MEGSRDMEASVSEKLFSPPQEKVPRLPALNSALISLLIENLVSVRKLWRKVKTLILANHKNMFCAHWYVMISLRFRVRIFVFLEYNCSLMPIINNTNKMLEITLTHSLSHPRMMCNWLNCKQYGWSLVHLLKRPRAWAHISSTH